MVNPSGRNARNSAASVSAKMSAMAAHCPDHNVLDLGVGRR
jgi:hypothetical protein